MKIIQYLRNPINRFSPLSQLSDLHREMNRLFENGSFPETNAGWTPALDVTQDQDHVKVVVELPGLKKEEIEITLQENVLTIGGERQDVTERMEGQAYRTERAFGRFQRAVELPAEVDATRVTADYQNGLLIVTLAKAEEAKPKQITINVA